jgi:hypothetical protein
MGSPVGLKQMKLKGFRSFLRWVFALHFAALNVIAAGK